MDEIIKIKAEIFDIIQQQEEYIAEANKIQQAKVDKLKILREHQQKILTLQEAEQKTLKDEIIKIKAELFDLIQQQEQYLATANNLQQTKNDKLKVLDDIKNISKQ